MASAAMALSSVTVVTMSLRLIRNLNSNAVMRSGMLERPVLTTALWGFGQPFSEWGIFRASGLCKAFRGSLPDSRWCLSEWLARLGLISPLPRAHEVPANA